MTEPKEGDLRVWWIPQIPMKEVFYVPVKDAEHGASMLNALAEYDAFQYLNKVKPDYSNSGGLDIRRNGEWEEWECPDTFESDPSEIYPQPSLGWCAGLNWS